MAGDPDWDKFPPDREITREDLDADWNRAMRGYVPDIWDPNKFECERLRALGLEETAANNMMVSLTPLRFWPRTENGAVLAALLGGALVILTVLALHW